jgi:glycosyltransferase involved in cell wall biosynthesis
MIMKKFLKSFFILVFINFRFAMEIPFFSVIITTFNRYELVQRAIESLLRQSEKQWEAIIVDDGSNDKTFEYSVSLCRTDSRFSFVYQSNRGSAFARETGLKLANGRYVTFLDSDDEYEVDHLLFRKRILVENPFIDFLYGGFRVIGSNLVPDLHNPKKLIPLEQCVVGGTFFIRRTSLARLGGIPKLEYAEDARLFELARREKLVIKKVDFPTYIYHRDHESSITKDLML